MTTQSVWLITGASSGLGLSLALYAVNAGAKVIGTVRKTNTDAAGKLKSLGVTVMALDVTETPSHIGQSVADAANIHGRIDVLVNNAGYSIIGAVEDLTMESSRQQFDTNFFGPLALSRSVVPGMRERKSGTIVNVSSVAGFDGLPSCGAYAASKFALEGLSESLSHELEPFNIQVLIVEPGAFRTNFLEAFVAPEPSAPYQNGPVADTLTKFKEWSGKQPGDPAKAAKAIFETVEGLGDAKDLKGKIRRLPLGNDCIGRFEAKINSLQHDLDLTRAIASKTDVSE